MALTRQAKPLNSSQLTKVLTHVQTIENQAMVMFSFYAGLRACEIAGLTWDMLTDAEHTLTDTLTLPNIASKGTKGGRVIPLHRQLVEALESMGAGDGVRSHHRHVFRNRSGEPMSANAVAQRFRRWFLEVGYQGCSSHSGRRTFCTTLAKSIGAHGGSLKDVQQLMGHASLAWTETYVVPGWDAKRSAVGGLGIG